ncbi:hypothetical protein [Deinococcus aluminii]|uniref:Uncharacterized protein n=1 Tax=Deinococcus aluminii TaxID=1656885 RepID=A0ABP9XAN0_9DEIO
MNRSLSAVRLTALLTTLLASAALAAGPRSSLIGASFSEDAEIVTGSPELAEFAGALRQVATAAGGSCVKSEYVLWDSQDGLEDTFTRGLKSLGYTYTLLDSSDDEDGHFDVFRVSQGNTTLAGIWAESDGTVLLGWCTLKTAQAAEPARTAPATSAPVAGASAWPVFGTFKVGDRVQFYAPNGWHQGVVKQVGPQPGKSTGQDWAQEKKYLITRSDISWDEWQEWGNVAHLSRSPYWTGFFVGDWALGEMMAVNTSVSGSVETTEFSYAGASEGLRIKADGTYEWKEGGGQVTRGRWSAAPDGPGIVVKDAKGRVWTLRNQTNLTTEKIRKLESARLYPSDPSQMGKAATRPIRR